MIKRPDCIWGGKTEHFGFPRPRRIRKLLRHFPAFWRILFTRIVPRLNRGSKRTLKKKGDGRAEDGEK